MLSSFRYEIDSDPDARAFIVTVDIKLCFKGEDCEFSHTIMDNVEVPYPMCRLDAGFLDPGLYSELCIRVGRDVLSIIRGHV